MAARIDGALTLSEWFGHPPACFPDSFLQGLIVTLVQEVEKARRQVKTDSYAMSLGELVTMYESRELNINPAFQRLFRWNINQKSRFVESVLLGIPIPSIFVFETENSQWELVDGLQRVSTVLEFMGKLRVDGKEAPRLR